MKKFTATSLFVSYSTRNRRDHCRGRQVWGGRVPDSTADVQGSVRGEKLPEPTRLSCAEWASIGMWSADGIWSDNASAPIGNDNPMEGHLNNREEHEEHEGFEMKYEGFGPSRSSWSSWSLAPDRFARGSSSVNEARPATYGDAGGNGPPGFR